MAIFVGAVSIIGQLPHLPANASDDNIFGGITAILGAIAYRSAKQRRLQLKPDTRTRVATEAVALGVVCVPFLFAAPIQDGIVHHPWSAVVIPAWSIVAYAIVRFKRIEPQVTSLRQ